VYGAPHSISNLAVDLVIGSLAKIKLGFKKIESVPGKTKLAGKPVRMKSFG
jgi:hypothetical protein